MDINNRLCNQLNVIFIQVYCCGQNVNFQKVRNNGWTTENVVRCQYCLQTVLTFPIVFFVFSINFHSSVIFHFQSYNGFSDEPICIIFTNLTFVGYSFSLNLKSAMRLRQVKQHFVSAIIIVSSVLGKFLRFLIFFSIYLCVQPIEEAGFVQFFNIPQIKDDFIGDESVSL